MNKIALLVQCGDGGVQWIPYFLHYYNKNWNCDNFIDTVFLFENNVPDIKREKKNIKIMKTGAVSWGQGMIRALQELDYKYIILFHEDYFITDKPDIDKLKKLIDIMDKNNFNLLKICGDWAGNTATPKLPMGKLSEEDEVYLYSKEGLYLTSHQPSIWSREYLLKTIEPGYNPWAHELQGHSKAYSLNLPVHAYVGITPIPYAECVTAGKPRPTCIQFFEVDL